MDDSSEKRNDAAKKSSAKKKLSGISGVRHIVQVVMLILFALPLLCAGWALFGLTPSGNELATPSDLIFYGTLSASQIGSVDLIDPFAALQEIVASKSLSLTVIIGGLIPLIVYGAIRGRVFCGWVCPVNLFLEIIDWLRKKLKIRIREHVLPRRTKVWVALAILVLSAILSFPVFEYFTPISAINKFIAFGSLVGVFTLLAIVIAELFWGHRVWCRSICPLGGFYEVVGKVGLVQVKMKHDACTKCSVCKAACLCDPEILNSVIEGSDAYVKAGDCMLCGKCVDVCPTKALSIGVGRKVK